MRGNRSTNPRRSARAFTLAGLAALASLGATAVPAGAAPVPDDKILLRNITPTTAEVCAAGARPAVPTAYGVFDGEDQPFGTSNASCIALDGLKPATKYHFVFKSGPVPTQLTSEGEFSFTTAPPPAGLVVARNVTSSSAEICDTSTTAVVERHVVYVEGGVGDPVRKRTESNEKCTLVSGLDQSRVYRFQLKTSNVGAADSELALLGSAVVRTSASAQNGPVFSSDVSERSATIANSPVPMPTGLRYAVYDGDTKVGSSTFGALSIHSLTPNTTYTLTFKAGTQEATDAELATVGTVTFKTWPELPPAPKVTVEQVGTKSALVCGVPKAEQALLRWVVFNGDTQLNHAFQECVLVTGLASGRSFLLTLKQAPAGAPDSELVTEGTVLVSTKFGSTAKAERITATSVAVCLDFWEIPYGTEAFQAYDGVTKVGEISAQQSACVPVGGLTPSTTYTLTLKSTYEGRTDQANWGNVTFTTLAATPMPTPTPTATPEPTVTPTPTAIPEPTITPTPQDQVVPYAYALAGTASLKTLTKGSLPLTGGIDAKLGIPSGKFTGDLTLAPSTGNLTALGFLPVVAKVNLVPTEQVTGTLKSGKLTAVAKVRIKLPSVKTLGIELAGGANCQAKQISSITLASTQATFLPLSGGPIAGTFSISDLSGCGFLTGIVSPLTKGAGNAIALNLTPRPITS